jgi:hypothetical protein
MRELIITNGDMAVARLRAAGVTGEMLPWRDLLYEGPVPHSLDLHALSTVRARYLTSRGWGCDRDIEAEFQERDARIARHAEFDVVTLWFEHDLTDTLQLLQVLAFFAVQRRPKDTLRIVHTDKHITSLDDVDIRRFAAGSKPVGTARLNQAREAWARWREPDPRPWAALLHRPRLNLKHLWFAINTSLWLLPDAGRGLTYPEQLALKSLDQAPLTPGELFAAFSRHSDRTYGRWMGDWSYFAMLDRLAANPAPLIEALDGGPFAPGLPAERHDAYLASRPRLTAAGRHVLGGTADWALMTNFDFWVGGAHVTGDRIWSYDTQQHRVVSRALR